MNSFGQQVLDFYNRLGNGPPIPSQVEVLYPHKQREVRQVMELFYHKFYNDDNPRIFLIGINPGRLGAGTTGIPFTDPIRLREICGIDHDFELRAELSSKFIYQMISACGGAPYFYNNFYFTSVSPLGFTSDGKNLNYYDIKELQETWEPFMVDSLQQQIKFGAHTIAYCLGKGKNLRYLQQVSERHALFEQVRPLPHPRWIMQYRLKRLNEFIALYRSRLLGLAQTT